MTRVEAESHLKNLLASRVDAFEDSRDGARLVWFGCITKPFDYVCAAVSYKTREEALESARWAYDWFKRNIQTVIEEKRARGA